MQVTVFPSHLHGTVNAPRSKSAAHRLLVCAALSEGVSTVRSLPAGDDVAATLDALRRFGAEIETEHNVVFVRGIPRKKAEPVTVHCRESASTLRFLIPLALLTGRETLFCGEGRLLSRPVDAYRPVCEQAGGSLTVRDDGILVRGKLRPDVYEIDASQSSQFVSGMLMALGGIGGGSLRLLSPPVSRPYVDRTVDALARFGVKVTEESGTFTVLGKCRPCRTRVEGDWSSGAVWHAANALGASIAVTGLDENSGQADEAVKEHLASLCDGAKTISLADTPDLFPLLAAVAAAKHGATFTDIARLCFKESDRVAAMKEELVKFGAAVDVTDDTFRVLPPKGGIVPPKEPLSGHHDHRVVMALSVLCCVTGGTVTDAEAVTKSYPAFFTRLRSLGADIR